MHVRDEGEWVRDEGRQMRYEGGELGGGVREVG